MGTVHQFKGKKNPKKRPIQTCTRKGCGEKARWRAALVLHPFVIYMDQRAVRFAVRSVVCDKCREEIGNDWTKHIAVDLEFIRMRQVAGMRGFSPMDPNRTEVEYTLHGS
ncbi:MAG: hypothetical protein ACWGQW_25780 [bacterium]